MLPDSIIGNENKENEFLNLLLMVKQFNNSPLLKRICLYSFGLGSCLAALIIFSSAILEYQTRRNQISICLEEIVELNLEPLSAAVWKNESQLIEKTLSAMQQKCQPTTESNLSPLFLALVFDDDRRIHVGKTLIQGPDLKQVYPISYWKRGGAQAYWLGELRVTQSLAGLYNEVSWTTLTRLISVLIVIAATTLCFATLAYIIVIRRVQMLMEHFDTNDFVDSAISLVENENTEVSRLLLSFLDLRYQLEEKYKNSESKIILCQKERDVAVKASEVKSQFLSKMSHELRTPMNGLLGFTTLLLETKLEDEQREYAQTIQASLESLLYVVNDVLDLSRIESGDLNVSNIPFSLRSVVSGVAVLLKNRAVSKGLAFESRISPDIPQTLRGDPVRIRQVLMNLVANAIQHTQEGYVLINIEYSSQEKKRAYIRIAIEDSGTIPTQRGKQGRNEVEKGFSAELREKRSLGLDVCYQLVGLMGSVLLNESRAEMGSTFWFELSLPIIKESTSPDPIDFTQSKSLRVLVVDSYELSRKITLELLQEWGIIFEAVSTAGEALKILKQGDETKDGAFNMVLCDDLLLDLSGLEICQRIRQIYPVNIQIVILCSNPQLGDAEAFFFSGANGFISKQLRDPFLRAVMCQVYFERNRQGAEKRLVTRYTVSDAEQGESNDLLLSHFGSSSVLVVEHNIVNQQLVTKMLENNACHVDLASNGFEAVELFKQNNYQLILMDCLMPDMDGYETTQILRKIEASTENKQRTPIVALTTQTIDGEADRCFKVGMDEFMAKPFKLAQLEMVLERYIN